MHKFSNILMFSQSNSNGAEKQQGLCTPISHCIFSTLKSGNAKPFYLGILDPFPSQISRIVCFITQMGSNQDMCWLFSGGGHGVLYFFGRLLWPKKRISTFMNKGCCIDQKHATITIFALQTLIFLRTSGVRIYENHAHLFVSSWRLLCSFKFSLRKIGWRSRVYANPPRNWGGSSSWNVVWRFQQWQFCRMSQIDWCRMRVVGKI